MKVEFICKGKSCVKLWPSEEIFIYLTFIVQTFTEKKRETTALVFNACVVNGVECRCAAGGAVGHITALPVRISDTKGLWFL